MKSIAAIAFALLWMASAKAAPQVDAIQCDPQGSQMELNTCAALRLSAADDELNATWREVQAKIGTRPVAIAKLKAAQRLWIQLRDADLEARFPLEKGETERTQYGSIHPMELADAKAAFTRERTRYLRSIWLDDAIH